MREEQNRAGAIELLMPTIQSADLWRESGRYDDYGKEMLRIRDRHERDMLFGPTNEEMITEIFRASVRSYKDLPLNLYHIQWKFRDEVRPRFGVMRSREFLMKDAYSFDLDAGGARHSYNKMFTAYLRTFSRFGLTAIPMVADTGPIGGDLSHEFIILASTGESEVFCHKDYLDVRRRRRTSTSTTRGDAGRVREMDVAYAATSEKHDAAAFDAMPEAARISARGIEVGHIFYFGTKYSAADEGGGQRSRRQGAHRPHGLLRHRPSRLAAALIEANHDEAGMIWPEAAAPFEVGVINLKVGDAACDGACSRIIAALGKAGVDALYDDRDERPGAKFATMDLIGLPHQVIVGPKGLPMARSS